MKTLLILLTLLLAGSGMADARKLPRLKRTVAATEQFDTIAEPRADAVRFSGYEKTNPSTRETFFITNNLEGDSTISAVELTLTYFDAEGRQLHERTETVSCLIPPGETRAVDVRSWDANHAFHYYLSPAPARRRSSPFSVRSRLRKLILVK